MLESAFLVSWFLGTKRCSWFLCFFGCWSLFVSLNETKNKEEKTWERMGDLVLQFLPARTLLYVTFVALCWSATVLEVLIVNPSLEDS